MTVPKWTEERTNTLMQAVEGVSPVSREMVAELAEKLETSTRSIASKLRKMDVEVEAATAAAKAFTDEETASLRDFVTDNSGKLTYAEIAAAFPGDFTAKAIQGKVLSMELTGHVKETPKTEAVKLYTDAEQEKVVSMVNAGAFVEDIAAAVNKSVISVRGKALSLFKNGDIAAMPKQRDVKGPAKDAFEGLDIGNLTVADIAEKTGKTVRGVKTMLTRRRLKASDYDGLAKGEKAAA